MVTVAVDAGHAGYGVTPGKRSPNGEYEWNFNNTVALACISRLKASGVETVRIDDPTGRTDISLPNRVARANCSGADFFVSIHANAATGRWSSGWGGTETYIPSGSNPKSLAAARQIHPRLVGAMGLQDRGIKRANFYVIRYTNMPGVLVEVGFMDSTIDIVKLRNKTVLRNAGVAIADGILKNFGITPKSGAAPSAPSTKNLYRIRKSWKDSKSQKGAYSKLKSAVDVAKKHSGYKVYDANGKQVWPEAATGDSLYRVRKSWSDAKSQKGAFKDLSGAKEIADKHSGYNVYDGNGKLVYKGGSEKKTADLYRVRKSWKDAKSQKGAFKDLSGAKEVADKHPGYTVYDADGKAVYKSEVKKSEPADNLYRVRKSWSDAKSQKGAFKDLSGAKEVADKHDGYHVYNGKGKKVYTPSDDADTGDALYRVRKTWKDAKSQVGAFKDLDGAKKVADEYKGYNVFDGDGKKVYSGNPDKQKQEAPAKPAPKDDVDHSEHTAIQGKMEVDAKKMQAYLENVNPDFKDAKAVTEAFVKMGRKYGIRSDIAFCQSLIETGWFRFDGGTAVTPDQHNYCGMGVTSKGKKGNSFDTVEDGVEAQIQHLYGYATTEEIPEKRILSPRLKYVTRGIAPHWEDLSMKWAMNENYGTHILSMFDKLKAFKVKTPAGEKPEEKPEEAPKDDEKQAGGESINVGLLNKVLELVWSMFSSKHKK